ncbi:hypothetical protein Q1695_016384 [Nippostrongylus brasiliensis]|nr:hypothetical protein Q1695_016384 [Nippostrongylus brasiliensis]
MLIWLEGSDQQVDRLGVDVPMVKMIAMGIDPIGSVGFMKTSELDERQHKYTRSAWEVGLLEKFKRLVLNQSDVI